MDDILESPIDILDEPIFEDIDPLKLFYVESEYFEDAILMEASGANSKNIFSKLHDILRKAKRAIGHIISKIFHGIKTLFSGGRKVKTGNAVAAAAGLPATNRSINVPPAADITEEQKNTVHDMVASMVGSMITDISDDRITVLCPGDLVSMDPKDPNINVKGKEINAAWARVKLVLRLILDPMPINQYNEFFEKITNIGSPETFSERDVDAMYYMCQDFVGRASISDYAKDAAAQKLQNKGGFVGAGSASYDKLTITMDQLVDFQKKVDQMCVLGEKFDNYLEPLNVSENFRQNHKANAVKKSYMTILNDMAWACVELQGGLHAIANGLTAIYEVGAQYFDTVDNPKMLAAFIEEAIKTGMPGKYIVRNVYNICRANIKGNPKVDSPIMGFGRLTLIPEGDIIYKVAINRYGIRSNKNDFIVLDAVRKIGDPNFTAMFADTVTKYGDYAVNVVEKVQAGHKFEPNRITASNLANTINGRFKKEGINLKINDIKPDAFGQRGGKYVILDYGYILRTSVGGNIIPDRTPVPV